LQKYTIDSKFIIFYYQPSWRPAAAGGHDGWNLTAVRHVGWSLTAVAHGGWSPATAVRPTAVGHERQPMTVGWFFCFLQMTSKHETANTKVVCLEKKLCITTFSFDVV
jgi:hypothetical protein